MDLPPLLEHTPLQLPAHHHHVDFDDLVELIVPPSEPVRGRPRVELRKMSLPVSFTSKPSEVDLDDPSFIPTQPRRLSIRLPSFTRAVSPPPPASGSSVPGAECLRSCLARTTSRDGPSSSTAGIPIPSSSSSTSAHPSVLGPRIGRSRSLDPAATAPIAGCSFASLLSTSPVAHAHAHAGPSSPPSSYSGPTHPQPPHQQQHVPRARRRSSVSSTNTRPGSSLPPSPGSPGAHAESLLLPLRNCCAACIPLTNLALSLPLSSPLGLGGGGEGGGALDELERFSPGAARKLAEDRAEAAKDAELQGRWRAHTKAGVHVRVDEVQKKHEGRETGLRETDPVEEEEEEEALGDGDRAGACPVAVVRNALCGSAPSTRPTTTTTAAAAPTPAAVAAGWAEAKDEAVFLETPLSTPATDEMSASPSTSPGSAAGPLTPPPLSPPSSSVPLANASRPARPQLAPVAAGKKRFWSLSLGVLPAFHNPFVHKDDGSPPAASAGQAGSMASVAGGHGRF